MSARKPRASGKSNTDLANEYIAYCDRRYERNTVFTYARTMATLVPFMDGRELHFITCSAGDLERFVDEPVSMGQRKGLERSPATRRRRIFELRSFYKWLCMVEGYRHLNDNPSLALIVPAVHNERPNPIPESVWTAVWSSELDDVARAALGVCFFGGLRRAEAVRLSPLSMQLKEPVALTNFWSKGGHTVEFHPLGSCYRMFCERRTDLVGDPRLFPLAMKRVLVARRSEPLFLDWRDKMDYRKFTGGRYAPTPTNVINPEAFNRYFHEMQRVARVPEAQWCTPHQLRHGFVTYMLQMLGEDKIVKVSRLARHASVKTTMRYIAVGRGQDPLADEWGEDDDEGDGGALTSVPRW